MAIVEGRARQGVAAALCIAAGVAGCGLLPGEQAPSSPPAQTSALPQAPAATPGASLQPIPPTPKPKPTPPTETVHLVGLDRNGVQELMGPPLVASEAAAAKVWQYRDGPCQLELYFSYDLARADFYVLSYTVNRGTGSPAADRQCLTRLAHDRTR